MRLILALLLATSLTHANGVLQIRGANRANVTQRTHAVKAVVRDRLAEVTVEQTFHNGSRNRLEGIYTFPLPDNAGITSFAMTMGGKMVTGKVLERGKAKKIYESIVSKKRDPGLLEKVDRGVFRARVFPIEPQSDLTIRVVYQQILPEHEGVSEFRYPLALDRMGAGRVSAVAIEMDVASSAEIRKVHCTSHRVAVERKTDKHVKVAWSAEVDPQNRDFLLYLTRDKKAVRFSLSSHKEVAKNGSFLATIAAPETKERLPKDVTYVLDTSGSMDGPKLAQAKKALQQGIDMLRDGDRFNVVAFSTTTRGFRDGLIESTPENRNAAKRWIDGLKAEGGTAIADALKTALASGDRERLGIVAFLTDGRPTVGLQDTNKILELLAQVNTNTKRVFVFGIGFDQEVKLLDRIAIDTRAAREYISETQALDVVVRRFFGRIDHPAMTDLRLEAPEGVVEVYPPSLPDLFAGDELMISARYSKPGPVLLRLHGKVNGKPVVLDYEGTLTDKPDLAGIERVWAQKKVDFLLAQKESEEVRKEIVRLATKHSIVTKYTSGLVVEDDELKDVTIDNNEVDADSEFEETAGEDGMADSPFTGPSTNSAIGLGGGAGGGKRGRGGRRNLRAGGGSSLTETATELGLKWLADHQDVDGDGRWDGDGFAKHDPADDKTGGPGQAQYDVGLTGLSLLAFLGAGYTDRGSHRENRYAKTVRTGLRFLMTQQDDEGCFGSRASQHFMYNHGLATLAMTEAYWMTRNPRYKKPAQEGLNFIARARNPYLGWRYEPRSGENDTSVTGLMVMALKSGKFGGLEIDPDAFEGARNWIEKMTDEATGHVRYGAPRRPPSRVAVLKDRFPPSHEEAMTAVGILVRIFLGEDPRRSEKVRLGADLLAENLPVWGPKKGTVDMNYWYHATLAMFQVGGKHWKAWNTAMKEAIVASQHPKGSGATTGSWDPVGPWGDKGGRIYATAMMTMCLEVYYRYDKVWGARDRTRGRRGR